MSLVEFSIRHRRFINVLAAFLVLAGIYAATRMHREVFPNINLDIVVVRADYPGASPDQVERLLLQPIEKEIRAVGDVKEMSGIAVENLALVICEIDPNARKKGRVVQEIQRAVDRVADLPSDLPRRPTVREVQTRNNPIIEVALGGDLAEAELQRLAKGLETRLLEIPDVASVARRGWRDRQIWVEVDPATLQRYALSMATVSEQLARHNVDIPGGLLPVGATEILLRTSGALRDPASVGNVVVRANDRGQPVRVRDVGTVAWAFAEGATLHRVNGSRAISLVVAKRPSGDAIHLVDRVRQAAVAYQHATPNLHITFINDMSFFIRRRLQVLSANGWIGLGLVVLAILAFLSIRTAIGAALGIPVAALTSLALLHGIGASINLITLFGMIMVVGMLVDEDLVIAENIHRYLEEHEDPAHAVVHGTQEIMRSVIATVATTIAAFLPLLFLAGTIGKFIQWIPIVVIVTLASSLVEALWILPSHLYDLARWLTGRRVAATRDWRWFLALRERYLRALRWGLRYRYWVVGGGTVLFAAACVLAVKVIPFHLFPSRGLEIFFVRAEAPLGTAVEETERLFLPLEATVRRLPATELEHFTTQIGIVQNDPDDPFTSRGSHVGQVAVYLTPANARERQLEAIMDELREPLRRIPGFTRIAVEKVRHGPPVGKPIQLTVRGPEFAALEAIAVEITRRLQAIDGVTDVRDDHEAGKPEMAMAIDPIAAARARIETTAIGRSVRAAYQGETATTSRVGDEERDIVVRFPPDVRRDPGQLHHVPIPNVAGQLIPLERVATPQATPSRAGIKHLDGARAVTISAEIDEARVAPMAVKSALAAGLAALAAAHPGYTVRYGGEVEKTQESLHSLRIAMALAAILILGILVWMLDSYGDAFVVLTTIPLGLVGVTIGFLCQGLSFSFMALLGIVGLAGIVVDSAIILLDFARRCQRTGKSLSESMCESARIRFRPIILVTLTTVLGIVPSAFGIGGTDPFIQPMALAMNWGLSFSTALNLFWVPCLAMVMDDVKRRLRGTPDGRVTGSAV